MSLIDLGLLARFRVYTFSCIIADPFVLANHCLQEPYFLREPLDYHFHARLHLDLHCVCLSVEVGSPWPAYKGCPLLAAKSLKMGFPEWWAFPEQNLAKVMDCHVRDEVTESRFPSIPGLHTCFLWWGSYCALGYPVWQKPAGEEQRPAVQPHSRHRLLPTNAFESRPSRACNETTAQGNLVTAAGGLTSELSGQSHQTPGLGAGTSNGLLWELSFGVITYTAIGNEDTKEESWETSPTMGSFLKYLSLTNTM